MAEARRARVLELLSAARVLADPGHPASRRLRERVEQTSGLSRPSVDLALERCLEQSASELELDSLLARTPEAPRALVLLSANVFVAPLRALAIARACSEQVVVRASRRDPALAEALHQLLPGAFELRAELEPRPGDHYFAYGSDDTLSRVRAGLPKGVSLHAHGFGLGAVVVEADAASDQLSSVARGIALDAALFDQRGCLSPRLVCVLGSDEATRELVRAVAQALQELSRSLPLGAESPDELAERRRFADAATYAFEVSDAGQSLVSLALDGRLLVPPPGRNLHVARVSEPVAALSPFAPYLTCLAVRGSASLVDRLRRAFPLARACEPGRMQTPPLDGPVDLRNLPA